MSDCGLTLLIFAVSVALFVADVLPMGLVVFSVPLALYFGGIIEAKEIFAPLVGQSIVLIVAMSVIGAALFRTGMAERIGRTLFRFAPGERSLIFVMMLFAGCLSAFVSNTGTVAILIPIVMGVAAAKKIRPSRLLIPLTAAATFGGNISVIGSPGNLIAKETIERLSEGAMSVSFFEYAKIGVPLLLVAAVFYAFAGPRIIPAKGEACGYVGAGSCARDNRGWKGWFTVGVLVLTIAAMVSADFVKWLPPMHITACVGAATVVLFGVISQKEAFAAFDLQAVFLLAFMPPLGTAMVKTGAADGISHAVVSAAGGHGPLLVMAILWLAVWALTQVMSNTAACALFCPIGWTIAKALGADPRAVVIAVLVASSVAVCTPLAIPANSMILEPGNLRFRDFFRPGICLSAVAFVLSMVLLPLLYPFHSDDRPLLADDDTAKLTELLSIPSVSHDIVQTDRAIEWMEAYLSERGVWCKTEVLPTDGRKVLYAATKPGLLTPDYTLVTHLDVVAAPESMFRPRLEGNRLYARGACDTKANAFCAAKVLVALNGKSSVGCVFASDEEIGSDSTFHMVKKGYGVPGRMVIVLDAAQLRTDIRYACKGNAYYRVTAEGKAGHSSLPEQCDNAIYRLAEAALRIRDRFPFQRPGEWGDVASVTIANAGDAENRIPGTAEMTVNVRFVEPDGLERHRRTIEQITGLKTEIIRGTQPAIGPNDDPEILRFRDAVKKAYPERSCELTRANAATDARCYAQFGKPLPMLGMNHDGGHTDCEWCETSDVAHFSGMLVDFIRAAKP